jgi:hypothetical protein
VFVVIIIEYLFVMLHRLLLDTDYEGQGGEGKHEAKAFGFSVPWEDGKKKHGQEPWMDSSSRRYEERRLP